MTDANKPRTFDDVAITYKKARSEFVDLRAERRRERAKAFVFKPLRTVQSFLRQDAEKNADAKSKKTFTQRVNEHYTAIMLGPLFPGIIISGVGAVLRNLAVAYSGPVIMVSGCALVGLTFLAEYVRRPPNNTDKT